MTTEQPSYPDEARTALLRSTRIAAACLRSPLAVALYASGENQAIAQAGYPPSHTPPDPAPALELARQILAAGVPRSSPDPHATSPADLAWASLGVLGYDTVGQPVLALVVLAPAPHVWAEADRIALEEIAGGAVAEIGLINARRQAEEQAAIATGRSSNGLDWLRNERETLYRLVLSQIPDVAILVFDHDLRYLFAEGAPLRSQGYESHQIEGRTLHEVLGPEGAALVLPGYQAALAGEIQVRELNVRSRMFMTSFTPIRDARGSVLAGMVVIQDITTYRQIEQGLRASEARYRAFVAATPDMLFRISREGIYLDLETSTPDNLVATPEQIIGRSVEDVLPPDVARQARAAVLAVCDGAPMRRFEYDMEALSGPGHFEARVVRADDDVALVIVRDISAQKQSEAALRRAYEQLQQANEDLARSSRLKDAFLASMSHELRTPLNTILGFTAILSEQIYGPLNEQQSQALASVDESGHQLLGLINDILELSSIEAGVVEIEPTLVSVDEICRSCLLLIEQQAQKKNVGVTYTISDPSLTLLLDPRRVNQILLNLLSNAVKFTPEAGEIGLDAGLSPDRQSLILTVWDRGIGIKADDLPRLFQPFVQLDSRLAREYSGTGLGLAIVERLARLHGGSVQVASRPGVGSSFTVTLPASNPQ